MRDCFSMTRRIGTFQLSSFRFTIATVSESHHHNLDHAWTAFATASYVLAASVVRMCFFPSFPVISTQQQPTTGGYHIRRLFASRL